MKKYMHVVLFILSTITATAQVSEIQFSYDDAGNRISRSLKPLETIYEHGVIEMAQADAGEWTSVSLQNTYQMPVVASTPGNRWPTWPFNTGSAEVDGKLFEAAT
jgi:hypothetical protein